MTVQAKVDCSAFQLEDVAHLNVLTEIDECFFACRNIRDRKLLQFIEGRRLLPLRRLGFNMAVRRRGSRDAGISAAADAMILVRRDRIHHGERRLRREFVVDRQGDVRSAGCKRGDCGLVRIGRVFRDRRDRFIRRSPFDLRDVDSARNHRRGEFLIGADRRLESIRKRDVDHVFIGIHLIPERVSDSAERFRFRRIQSLHQVAGRKQFRCRRIEEGTGRDARLDAALRRHSGELTALNGCRRIRCKIYGVLRRIRSLIRTDRASRHREGRCAGDCDVRSVSAAGQGSAVNAAARNRKCAVVAECDRSAVLRGFTAGDRAAVQRQFAAVNVDRSAVLRCGTADDGTAVNGHRAAEINRAAAAGGRGAAFDRTVLHIDGGVLADVNASGVRGRRAALDLAAVHRQHARIRGAAVAEREVAAVRARRAVLDRAAVQGDGTSGKYRDVAAEGGRIAVLDRAAVHRKRSAGLQ